MDWLLLMHQIPAKPTAFRARIWRRLLQIGAVAVKQAVYALPDREETREDFTWLVKEVRDGGGEAALVEARFIDGMNDDQVIALFRAARREDYDTVREEAEKLRAAWRGRANDGGSFGAVELARLRKRLDEVLSVDFFPDGEGERLAAVLGDIEAMLRQPREASLSRTAGEPAATGLDSLRGRTWVTRRNCYVDRLGCAWLIRRFIDPEARFRFVADAHHSPEPGEIRFDMAEAEFTHEEGGCSFETMVRRLALSAPGLIRVSRVIHDIDLKEMAFNLPETPGVQALFDGIVAAETDDLARIEKAATVLDGLLAFAQTRTH